MIKQVTFPATLSELPHMLEWVSSQLIFASVEKKKIELAVEEALVNVIQHSYQNLSGKIELSFKIVANSHVEIGIRDWGPLFNPLLNRPNPDLASPIEKRKEGGLGVFFLTNLLDDVFYESDGDSNLLVLIKRFSQKL